MRYFSINKIVFWLLMAAAFIPFAVVTNFKIGQIFMNAEKIFLYLLLGVIFCSFFVAGIRRYGGYLFLCAALLFGVYIVFGVLFLGAGASVVLRHAEFFLPFIVAAALTGSRIKFDRGDFEFVFFWVVVASAFIALIFYFFFPDVLQTKIGEFSEEVADVFSAGRLYWDGGVLSLLVVFIFFASPRVQKNKASIIGLVVVLAATLATQNRTMALACAILVVYYMKIGFKAIFYIAVIGVAGYVFFEYLPDNARDLFVTRFFFGDAASEFDRAFEIGRAVLYEQYFDLIKENSIFGAGLGFPLSYGYADGVSVYTSDISFVSFLVPFGFFGLALIIWFWRHIYSGIVALRSEVGAAYGRNLMVLFIVSMLVSLNIDVFSRNIFVLVLVALIFNMKPIAPRRGALRE